MKKVLKWLGIGAGALILLLLIGYTVIYFQTESRFNKIYAVQVQKIPIPKDSAALSMGKHLVQIKGCQDCHGADLGGKVFIDDPGLGRIVAANLTRGMGGIMRTYTNQDLTRALKHGVRKDGKPALLMPSNEYAPLSDEDMGSLMAYLKSLPPVDRELPKHSLRPLGRILTAFDKVPMIAAEKIDHRAKNVATVKPEISPGYGQYVAVSCVGCHRENYKGGEAVVPGSPKVPDITRTGNIGKWTEEQFINTLRTGVTPEGKKLNPKDMPWNMTKEFTETEIKSVYLFLKNLPA
jgi:cytochrome c553